MYFPLSAIYVFCQIEKQYCPDRKRHVTECASESAKLDQRMLSIRQEIDMYHSEAEHGWSKKPKKTWRKFLFLQSASSKKYHIHYVWTFIFCISRRVNVLFAFKEDLRMEESRWSLTISPDRLSLSIKNGCFDAINRAYIIYTTYRWGCHGRQID